LANQWGRDSGFQSGGKKGRGGLIAIAMMACIALGVAGGYAAFQLAQSDAATADDAQVAELEAKLASQAGELDAMAEKLAAITNKAQLTEQASSAVETLTRERDALASQNQTLRAELARLEAAQSAINQDARDAEDQIASELARLQTEVLPGLTAERDQLKRETLIMLSDQGALKARAKVAADRSAYDERRIAELQARLGDTEQELAASQEVLDKLKLEKRADKALETEAGGVAVDAVRQPDTSENSTLVARKPDAVAQALRTAPGLETLSAADRQRLTETLVVGECVTTALKSVFARVPILTLRNLIRDLNSDC